jgi:hypothetical protein
MLARARTCARQVPLSCRLPPLGLRIGNKLGAAPVASELRCVCCDVASRENYFDSTGVAMSFMSRG